MTQFQDNMKKAAADAVLTADERARLRARLERALSAHPAGISSPYARRFALPRFAFSARAAYALAAIILIISVSGGSAYAAEGSVPGDLLYSVKVNVNEPVALALAATPQAKADTHASIAADRLSEAQTLAADGSLTASTSDSLADSFAMNVTAASAIADTVATTEPALASSIRANLSDRVATGASALLTESDSKSGSVRLAANGLVRRALAVAIEDNHIDATVTASSSDEIAMAEPVSVSASAYTPQSPASSSESAPSVIHTFALMKSAAPEAPVSSMPQSPAFSAPPERFDPSALDDALASAQERFNAASTTLDATTTAAVRASLANVRLISIEVQSDLSAGDEDAARADSMHGLHELARAFILLPSS